LSNHKPWEQLKQIVPSNNQKEALRIRIRQSIQNQPSVVKPIVFLHWQSILTICILFLVCGGLLWVLLKDDIHPKTANQLIEGLENVSWELKDVYGKKTSEGFELYRKNKTLQVGSYHEVSEEEMKSITMKSAMFVHEELENFPYPTHMYIEHMKQENVALRYHFFIPQTEEKWSHFTFDYQQLEFAEIFQAMATLKIKGKEPYFHDEQIYVKHGYGSLIYPVGLEPKSISVNKETYYWKNPQIDDYLENIETQQWKKLSSEGNKSTFASPDGHQEVTIKINGSELTYEYVYLNQEN
jgi:hypothetical protein